jgi:hypothetical protein
MRRACLLFLMLPMLACANHLRYVEFENKTLNADVKDLRYMLEGSPELIELPKFELNFIKEERIESRTDIALTKVEEYTPYSFAHSLYEVPVGLVCIPAALALNVAGGLLPGVISREVVSGFTDWSFAAANPVMNAESYARFERREVTTVTRSADVRENLVQSPLADWPVLVRFEEDRAVRFTTDETGLLAVHVLELRMGALTAAPRKLTASIGSDKTPGAPLHVDLYIDRELGRRVFEASKLIPDINNAVVSSTRLSRAVFALDQIGFKEYSLRLEDRIYERFSGNVKFTDRFREVLDKLYKGEIQTGPPTWPVVIPPDEGARTAPPLSN